MYTGELTDANVCGIFHNAGDFVRRELRCGDFVIYAYSIDGLTSGSDISDYILKPISHLTADSIESLKQKAMETL